MTTYNFNENTRVKIPAILTLTRLGYKYLSLKDIDWDKQTNIVESIFLTSSKKINPTVEEAELKKHLKKIQTILDNQDLGEAFYSLLASKSGIKIIDFENPQNNTFNVVTEMPCKNDDEEFRPDITILVNGMPLSFIEVKKPNNKEGMLAERERINKRCQNMKFRKFINITQIMLFSNNMEYEDGAIQQVQGAFYATTAKEKVLFNQFKEEIQSELYQYLKDQDDEIENFVLKDTNNSTIKYSKEFIENKNTEKPTNRIILSLFSIQRFLTVLEYGIAYIKKSDENGARHTEKHIIRYPQFFASLAIRRKLEDGDKKGIIWHTQGSGKTALSYFNVKWLTDYFSKKQTLPKFYFIVDRIDLLKQAREEFTIRGLKINSIDSKEDFVKDLKKVSTLTGVSGKNEITVLNIHKFSQESRATTKNDYNVQTQRIYFIDEAHRSYNPKGSFLANLTQSDPNAIMISLTGTPLLAKDGGKIRVGSKEIFGDYIHKYYYDQSIKDGYTIRLIREEIDTKYKEELNKTLQDLEIKQTDKNIQLVYAHQKFCKPLLEYIVKDFTKSRIRYNDNSIGGMVVCASSEQAEILFNLFKENYQNKAQDDSAVNSAALILHDFEDKTTRADNITKFKEGKIDLLFVFNMLLTGFDAPRLKKLYLNRVVKDHNLLQTLTRVNRPYKTFSYGYVVDFADIRREFDLTNRQYWQELQGDLGKDLQGYSLLFKTKEEIEQELQEIHTNLFIYATDNAEKFSEQINQITSKDSLLAIRKSLTNAKELYNLIRYKGKDYEALLEKLDFKKFASLLNVVEDRINFINTKAALSQGAGDKILINEAIENYIFNFIKTGEYELKMVADKFYQQYIKVSRACKNNIDKKDPRYVSIMEEIKRIFQKKDISQMSQKDLEDNIKILDDVFLTIYELNRQDGLKSYKYHNDAKFVRVHKELLRSGKVNILEEKIFKALLSVKEKTDEELLNSDLLSNMSYFENEMERKIILSFENEDIQLNPNTSEFIKASIVRQYSEDNYQEYN
ncbi:MAG: DEAD/DEAH box helicase family protein [Endomicrobium sp.]|jgi:type I restriction enzyme R subunit|nr:DEAD/DEAH box helicase family protein [Endomicrobium sp.]